MKPWIRMVLALAAAQRKPIVAVVNTHWHLDHVSGNAELRAAHPGLRVYATDAIDGALEGFLAESAKESSTYLEDPQIPEGIRDDIQADIATIESGAALKPDVVVARSGRMELGGRPLQFYRVADAVTAADAWLYDEVSRVAVLGDLVTLPAPFLDTACPNGWMDALEAVTSVPFETAIPGHGRPMGRAQFETYRSSFGSFLRCVSSDSPAQACASQWAESVEPLLEDGDGDKSRALRMAEYYVDLLRANGGRSEYCGSTSGGNLPADPVRP